ncbi:MAG: pallilysin-related adhesin [Treponema sp.]|jgi:hypothetical protein|nr:pallilysin-related adhesin [Treponema sp.]
MSNKAVKLLTPFVFLTAAAGAAFLYFKPQLPEGPEAGGRQARVVIPQNVETLGFEGNGEAERMAYEDAMNAKIALKDGETVVAVLTQDLDGDMVDEQILAYRSLPESDSPVSISYINFDHALGGYRRIWSAPTAVSRPGTVSVYTQDIIGDRSICILVGGMNNNGEHTLTVFRIGGSESPSGASAPQETAFAKIAELRIDGSIQVQETERSQAYRMGVSRGQSFPIVAYGRDYSSSNILDQVELAYSYNSVRGVYEQTRRTRIPGSQIEQRRVRELLNGGKERFEEFVTGLWYYVSPQGTVDNRQYIYFDPPGGEIIFYGDAIQQVFNWQNSSATRHGLYIASQNISVTTLRRFLDIELESMDSIRVKVFEDIRLKIYVTAPWDGSYRRAETTETAAALSNPPNRVLPYIDASYDGSIGRIVFFPDGNYNLASGGSIQKQGRYAFFMLDNQELLELRPLNNGEGARETYRVERHNAEDSGFMTLTRIQLGTRGARELREAAISLERSGI